MARSLNGIVPRYARNMQDGTKFSCDANNDSGGKLLKIRRRREREREREKEGGKESRYGWNVTHVWRKGMPLCIRHTKISTSISPGNLAPWFWCLAVSKECRTADRAHKLMSHWETHKMKTEKRDKERMYEPSDRENVSLLLVCLAFRVFLFPFFVFFYKQVKSFTN